ncbi:hypothetical protein AAHH80_39415, partial [Burkholderia pseudomallei]
RIHGLRSGILLEPPQYDPYIASRALFSKFPPSFTRRLLPNKIQRHQDTLTEQNKNTRLRQKTHPRQNYN